MVRGRDLEFRVSKHIKECKRMQAMTGAIEVTMLQAQGAMMLEFRIVVQPCITGDEQKPMA